MSKRTQWQTTLAVLALLATGPVMAGTTAVYSYTGTVENCPVTGIPPCGVILGVGDSLSGLWVVDGGGADSSFDYTDVVSFSVMVGPFFAVDSGNSALTSGTVFTDAAGNIAGGELVILATALPDAPPTTVTLDLDTSTWVAEVLVPDAVFIASGTGAFSLVPVPGALALFAPAVLGLGFVRRRRR